MYGCQAKIGLLVPSVNTVVEPEFNAFMPEGYVVLSSRMRNSESTAEDSRAMLAHAERAADELGSARVDVVVLACTAASFVDGPDGECELRRLIGEAANATPVTTSAAVLGALNQLGAERITMVTPYPRELNELEVGFLGASGVTVVSEVGLGVEDPYEIALVEPDEVVDLALKTLSPEADALFLSCTNLRTFEIIEELEDRTGLPVISSNSATLCAALRVAGYEAAVSGLGRLLRTAVPV